MLDVRVVARSTMLKSALYFCLLPVAYTNYTALTQLFWLCQLDHSYKCHHIFQAFHKCNQPFAGMAHQPSMLMQLQLSAASVCLQWLEQHLEGIDRCLTPWLVVGMHRPMYVVHPHKSNRIVAGEGRCTALFQTCCDL